MEIYKSEHAAFQANSLVNHISTNLLKDKRIIAIAIFSLAFLVACYAALKYCQKKNTSPNLGPNIPVGSITPTAIFSPINSIKPKIIPLASFTPRILDRLIDIESIEFDSLIYPITLQSKALDEKSLKAFANIYYKNANNLDEAQIILLGERHDFLQHNFLETAILQEYGKENDILFLEGHEYEEEFGSLDKYNYFHFNFPITKNFSVNGWEKNLLPLEQMINFSKFGNEFKLEVLNEIKKYNENKTNCLNELDIKVDTLIKEYFANKQERDDFLISCVLKASSHHPNKKVFAVCGKGHIFDNVPEGFNIFDHLPSEVKCAAVVFKD
ncbi:MAG: hypothetical protein H0V82_01630 [Candidatus Protochlamydia sp.]|nr:hypothetical protein [Candidatus Protochlamydia sp.]